ncbi:MAG: hypothetical protein Q9Q40_10760 [Acidobacteriota bacterium]|nr:hypothetical protein [Acidobacteriota bacterium]MDQ7088029.1 hypothetical protein [Acidobacteriota bacterium]
MSFDRLRSLPTRLWLVAAAAALAVPAVSAIDPAYLAALESLAGSSGLIGDDLSPALTLDATSPAARLLRSRPRIEHAIELTVAAPPLRVHLPPELAARLPDVDRDGRADRAALAARIAQRTLAICRRSGLGAPLDDGDGEIDIYLLDLGRQARGFAALEQAVGPGPGAFGFAVVNASARETDQDFAAMVARLVARLAFAAVDAQAPSWWIEPSALWIQTRVSGPSLESERALTARWNHPEVGLTTSDPLLARGNIGLLWSTDSTSSASRALGAGWKALAQRVADTSAFEAIDQALVDALGLGLLDLQERAAAMQLATGFVPARMAGSVATLPVMGESSSLPLGPGSLGIFRIAPDPHQEGGTLLWVYPGEGDWRATLLCKRRIEGWELAPVEAGGDGNFQVSIPWQDYQRAFLLLTRLDRSSPPVRPAIAARAASSEGPYALSSLAATRRWERTVEIRWSSAWEDGLFGWIVERAPAPEGPWSVVGSVPLPALGARGEGGAYSLIDRSPGAGSYYRVVGLTTLGLRVTGPSIAVAGGE